MRATHFLAAFASLAAFVFLGGCRSMVTVPEQLQGEADPTRSIQQRVVVIVHGDASYLYHDRNGQAHQADVETLRETFAAARAMPAAEVFVFHQRPKNKLFGLFSQDDGTFYHFRGGTLVYQTTYDQDRSAPLAVEAKLLWDQRPVPLDSNALTAALYYGHAVSEEARPGYHRSRPDILFGIDGLARGLGRLAGPEESAFDAVVLSICDGGTPHTLAALASHARYLLASPGDLHLSFVDADLLGAVASTTDPGQWTRRLADHAFDRLTSRVTTAVTLAAYDVDRVLPAARRMTRKIEPDTSTAPAGARHVDCREMLSTRVDTTGVRTWDRPARFGLQSNRAPHSGWGCARRTPGPDNAPE